MDADDLRSFIRDIPDFPQAGVTFRDITPLLGDAGAFRAATELLVAPFDGPITKVVGIEARGFILAAPIALALGAGFVPVRKPGKLPVGHARATATSSSTAPTRSRCTATRSPPTTAS